jgi:hypothetical protein
MEEKQDLLQSAATPFSAESHIIPYRLPHPSSAAVIGWRSP